MKNKKFLLVSGYSFLVWGIFDLILKLYLYGFNQFDFLWFCSVALFLLSFGIILQNEMLLNGFLSIALLVQPFWILDFIWFAFFGVYLNGFTSYVFQPGNIFWEFINNMRHMFIIPFGFYVVFTTSKRNSKSYLFVPIFVIFLLVMSYTLSPRYNNLNCALEPCLGILKNFSGITYLLMYTLIIIAISLLINLIINISLEKFKKFKNSKIYRNSIFLTFIILLLISVASVTAGYFKYSEIPKYICLESEECLNCSISVDCKYVDIYIDDEKNLVLTYFIKNKDNDGYICDIYMRIKPYNTEYKKIIENYWVESNKKYEVWQNLTYPSVDSGIQLKPVCHIYKVA